MNIPYHPISCDFHDRLETLATVRRPVAVRFRDGEGVLQERHTPIADVYARSGVEYVVLGTGETQRLDQLISVDGALLESP